MALNEKAMLVNLSISSWQARKYDKKVSQEVAVSHNTTDLVGRYNKNLLPFEAKSYNAVVKASNAARIDHYKETLPWSDDGPRILPATNYLHYMEKIRQYRTTFDKSASEFLNEFPSLHANAQVVLGGLYNPADYPTIEQLRSKFSFSVKVYPLPDATDFRVSLTQGEVDSVREQIQNDTNNAVAGAMRDLYNRLYVAVSHMKDKLSSPEAIFRDSLVDNIKELCELMPRLNLTGDAVLEAKRIEIEKSLTSFNPSDIRDDTKLRETLARNAEIIANDLSAYMGVA